MNKEVSNYFDLPKTQDWCGCLNLCYQLEEHLIQLGKNNWLSFLEEIILVGDPVHCKPAGKVKAFLRTVGRFRVNSQQKND